VLSSFIYNNDYAVRFMQILRNVAIIIKVGIVAYKHQIGTEW